MSDRNASISHDHHQKPPTPNPYHFSSIKTLLESLRIFARNIQTFLSIFTLLTLPLCFLLLSLSAASSPTKSTVLRLQSLASLAHTRFEARHVWQESRDYALSLLRLKLLLSVPSFLLSLTAAVSTVVSADSSFRRRPISFRSALSALGPSWTRLLATSICIYVFLFLYSGSTRVLTAVIGGPNLELRLVGWAIGLVVEVHLMAVLGMGLVVSILEDEFGLGAIRVGWSLMEGRRLSGWLLSGLSAGVTWWVGLEMEGMAGTDGEDSSRAWTAVMMGWEGAVLVGIYGGVVVWGYVVATVFYCECRERHVVRDAKDGKCEVEDGIVLV